ncbi:MAG: glycogen synthase [Planctomycetes bacterium]|nr:glycogen synthase [Planctomycetota bacterium]
MKLAFVTPELDPLVRKTPLAELARVLPRALSQTGNEVRIFLPASEGLDLTNLPPLEPLGVVSVTSGESSTSFSIRKTTLEGMVVYVFGHPVMFKDRQPYGNDEGPYRDNGKRYAAFSRAVLASLPIVDFAPDVLHCFDWTTGLVPVIREVEYAERQPDHPAAKAGVYFHITNLAMQGSFERDLLAQIALPHSLFQRVDGIELGGKVSFLKAGCEFSTILGTNSIGHARRIQEQDRGYGLEETFRRRSKELVGIPTGVDYKTWNPEEDTLLAQSYGAADKNLNGKRRCKVALQQQLSLEKAPRSPLVALLGRFDTDNGFDLVAEQLTSILEHGFEVVLMGAGRPDMHERLKTLETSFPGRCRLIEGYYNNTAHAILGAADLLLFPSHYAAGSAQCAIAMRYGVVPIVYSGSGLEDYVLDFGTNQRTGTGFHFKNYTGEGLLAGVDEARKLYKDQAAWNTLVRRCLRQDFSWQAIAAEYVKAYRRVTRRIRPREKSA